MLKILIWIVFLFQIIFVRCFPAIKQGILAITGISTCGQSNGYCLVDIDCLSHQDFLPDQTGHCDRLKATYSSSSTFSCCRLTSNNESKIATTKHADSTTASAIRSSSVEKIDNLSNDVKQEKSFRLSNGLSDLTRQDTSFSAKNIRYELELESYDNDTAAIVDYNSRILKPSDVMKSSITQQIILSNTTDSNRNMSDDRMIWSGIDSQPNNNITSSFNTTNNYPCFDFRKISITETDTENSTFLNDSISYHYDYNNTDSEKPKCLDIAKNIENDRKCVNVWKFINAKGVLLCFGALLNPVWLITSAACVTKIPKTPIAFERFIKLLHVPRLNVLYFLSEHNKICTFSKFKMEIHRYKTVTEHNSGVFTIFKETLNSVLVMNVEEKNEVYGISNVIVHENYAMHKRADANNIGLVSLNKLVTGGCFACLPFQDSKYLDKICSIYKDYSSSHNEKKLIPECQDKLKALSIESKMYLSMFCSTQKDSVIMKTRSGNVLWCSNILLGIESTTNQEGFRIFTPVNEFSEWIIQNIALYS